MRVSPLTPTSELELISYPSVSLLTDFELCDDHLDWTLESHGIYIQLPNPALGTSPPTPPILPARPKESFRSISALPDFATPSFPNPRRLPKVFTATYLPDVASQQGWTKVEAIDSAIRKAGFDGVINTAVRASLRVTRYQSRKVELDYEAWMQWRSE
jgi:AMMECR1 domain-containing protein